MENDDSSLTVCSELNNVHFTLSLVRSVASELIQKNKTWRPAIFSLLCSNVVTSEQVAHKSDKSKNNKNDLKA